MPTKQIKIKDSEKDKTAKKKTAGPAKTKDFSVKNAKPAAKKAVPVTASAKKTQKPKSPSKKTVSSKSDAKNVKVKSEKNSQDLPGAVKKQIKKNVEKPREDLVKRDSAKKDDADFRKETQTKQESNKTFLEIKREAHEVQKPQEKKQDETKPLQPAPQSNRFAAHEDKSSQTIKSGFSNQEQPKTAPIKTDPAQTDPVKTTSVQTEPVKRETEKQEVPENKYIGSISINELITVRDLSEKMKLKVGDVLKKLLSIGSMATINQRLDTDTAILLANEFGYDAKLSSIYSEEEVSNELEAPEKLKTRFPVVTIMGHVDHGKTSLLDSIRSSHVVEGEHGGITQHIGAYKVKTSAGGYITFLDTPGHEAFTAMRSRGAQATDIVILVVSAADGVMPQTVEAINHAKAANVPIIVAVNKIDLPASDPQKIRQELSNYGLVPEEWGGDVIMVDISAKQRINIESLLDMILLRAEIMELKANPDRNAEGIVVEAKLDSRRGPVATVLVQKGTLKIGDNIVVGTTYGKVRAMIDEHGKRFNEAPPSAPAELLGINEPPQAGDKFVVVEHESQAREIAQSRKEKVKVDALRPRHHLSLQDISLGKTKDLRIILKADVQGSLGALSDALERLSTSEISLKIIHRGAGSITESDVALAVASDALIVGFNLRPDVSVEKLAQAEGVSIDV
ncbi:MAG: translation initiation factor IF-2, partial [Endomicrobium sp.]|nr:translation initiation factor IF-2 [Endomicrobium sp.]